MAGQKHKLERVVFSEMMFTKDSDQLSDVGVGRCYLVSQKLKHGNDVRVVVQGRGGSNASSALDQKLCLGRAEAIREELKKFGIAESRMSAVTFGDASASFKADWARGGHERAEFEIEAEESRRQLP
jgi:outer membrane protein OmpA-like peptidoglycan-associated protein